MMRHLALLLFVATLALPARGEDLGGLTLAQLLSLRAGIEEQLRERKIVRTANLTGELAEHLFVTTFGWSLAPASQKGFDATDGALRYQIKARRVSQDATHHQLGAIRDMEGFDVLAVLIFDKGYRIRQAALIPSSWVRAQAAYNGYTNSFRLVVTDEMLSAEDIRNVTSEMAQGLAAHP